MAEYTPGIERFRAFFIALIRMDMKISAKLKTKLMFSIKTLM